MSSGGFGADVVVGEVSVDGGLQMRRRLVGAAQNSSTAFSHEALVGVKMEGDGGMTGKPGDHLRVFVKCKIIDLIGFCIDRKRPNLHTTFAMNLMTMTRQLPSAPRI